MFKASSTGPETKDVTTDSKRAPSTSPWNGPQHQRFRTVFSSLYSAKCTQLCAPYCIDMKINLVLSHEKFWSCSGVSALGAVIIFRKKENKYNWHRSLWWRTEDGGSVSLRNFDTNLLDYTVSQIRNHTIFTFTFFEPCILIHLVIRTINVLI